MTVGYDVKKTEGRKAADSGGGTRFNALPAGSYAASVYEVTAGEYKNGNNKGRPNIRVQFKILDGQTGANRRIFQTIGIFDEWNNDKKSDNFTFFQFFAAAVGKSETDFRAWFDEEDDPFGDLPSPTQLEGRKVVLRLKVVPDDYGYKRAKEEGSLGADETEDDFTTNDIAGFKVYDGTLPAAGEANTSSPKVAAVDL